MRADLILSIEAPEPAHLIQCLPPSFTVLSLGVSAELDKRRKDTQYDIQGLSLKHQLLLLIIKEKIRLQGPDVARHCS